MTQKQGSILPILTLLTCLFIFAEFLFLAINYHTSHLDNAVSHELKSQLMQILPHAKFASLFLAIPLIAFIASQLLLYALFIYALWYIATAIGDICFLSSGSKRILAVFLWIISIAAVLAANCYFVPHSFFSSLVLHNLLNDSLTNAQLNMTLILATAILLAAFALALFNIFYNFYNKKFFSHDCVALSLVVFMFMLFASNKIHFPANNIASVATEKTPNIFIIGFDALRPDYLSYFNQQRRHTPEFDNFLKSATLFTEAYTPDARTFPAWVSILTAKYPLHTNGREDNIDIATVKREHLLTDILKKHGYETIYASDDNRFNNINNADFGFDQVIGPSGNAFDFIVSAINDFPISNLLLTTPMGKLLFPDTIGNHASPHTYDPDNFIQLLAEGLNKRDLNKPVFLAAHFNITGWPFYFYNDHQPYNAISSAYYKNAVVAGDNQFGKLLALLQRNGLLSHAIFILLSDHGITLQLPGDRVITEALYQGNKNNIKVKRSQYSPLRFVVGKQQAANTNDEEKIIYLDESLKNNPDQLIAAIQKATSPLNPDLYGVDTSWGYGNDLLSLKQNRPLLAVKAYGVELGTPHHVAGRSLLTDIAPTILDLLNLPVPQQIDGSSLKPYLFNNALRLSDRRPVFLESSFTIPEIEHENISVDKVLIKSLSLYQINPDNALLSMAPSAEKYAIARKQRAIILGDWLLAYYPSSTRYRMDKQNKRMENYTLPPYAVLVNLKTGKWSTELDNPFAVQSPFKILREKLDQFYGDEMKNYGI